jgi:hypothetical protein
MTMALDTGRAALALCLAVFAACVPPLRVAVLDWIVDADLVPGMTSAGIVKTGGPSSDVPAA